MNQFFLPIFLHKCRKTGKTSLQFVFLHDIVESTISRWSLQENGSDFTLSKPTEGVKLSGAAAGGATVNGSTLWRHPLGGGRRCNVRIGSSRSAVTMNISWHRLLLVRISQATGRRRYWTDILKIIFLIPCIRLYMQRIWGFLFQFT